MAENSIPVDLFNPGQVFACLGFLEAAEVLLGDAEGGFDWSNEGNVRFRLRAKGDEDPVRAVLAFLDSAQVLSLTPSGSKNTTKGWDVPSVILDADSPFPFPDPQSPATLPAALDGPGPTGQKVRVVIDHWGEAAARTHRDAVKFWGGAGGYPGAALARDALDIIRGRCTQAGDAPFELTAPQSSSFRLDWRRDYIPIDAGLSLNKHSGKIVTMGFPLVEILAAVGLGNARPTRVRALEYRYAVIGIDSKIPRGDSHGSLFARNLLCAALGGATLPFRRRIFQMRLGWPAKEGQARAITTVTEVPDDNRTRD